MNTTPFIESLNWRYATKKFDVTRKLDEATLSALLEATRLSASSFGLQPWKFIVIESQAVKEKLRPHAWNQPQITDCSHLVVIATKTSIDAEYVNQFADRIVKERNVSPDVIAGYRGMMLDFVPKVQGERGVQWMKHQAYIALSTLLSAAAVAKIDACPMEGFDAAQFDSILNLSARGYSATVLCPLGFRAADDIYAKLKKVRFSTEEVVERL